LRFLVNFLQFISQQACSEAISGVYSLVFDLCKPLGGYACHSPAKGLARGLKWHHVVGIEDMFDVFGRQLVYKGPSYSLQALSLVFGHEWGDFGWGEILPVFGEYGAGKA
jgi:hypothetical protein